MRLKNPIPFDAPDGRPVSDIFVLIVPLCLLFAIIALLLRGLDINILAQIGFIVLIGLASKNGLTREELAEAITHLAFYSGWPSSVTAATIAKDVLVPK